MSYSDWFPAGIQPVHFGTYEVEDSSGQLVPAAFARNGWDIDEKLVARWRGLAAPAHDAASAEPVELLFPLRLEEELMFIYEAPAHVKTEFSEALRYDPVKDEVVLFERRSSNTPREAYPEGWKLFQWKIPRRKLIAMIKGRGKN